MKINLSQDRKKNIFDLAIYLLVTILLAILVAVFDGSWLSFLYTFLLIVGIYLNSHKIKEGLLLYAISSLIYIFISLKSIFYGELILNIAFIIYYISYYIYLKLHNKFTIKSLKFYQYFLCLGFLILASVGYYFVLKNIESNNPLLNSLSTAFSIIAVVLTASRFYQQYYVWIATNLIQITLWSFDIAENGLSNLVIIVYNAIFILINIYNLVAWRKAYFKQTEEENLVHPKQ